MKCKFNTDILFKHFNLMNVLFSYSDEIRVYNPSTERFDLLPQRMLMPRGGPAAFLIPENFVQCG